MPVPVAIRVLSPSKVVISGPEALAQWRAERKLKVPGHQFTWQFKRRRWDGTWSPGDWLRERGDGFEMQCSRGLVRRVVTDLGGDVTFTTATLDEIGEFCRHNAAVEKLRDYQRKALVRVLTEGWARVAYATNAGKGAIIALLARYAADRGHRCLILCDEIAVFDALLGELRTWGDMEPGVVKAGSGEPPVHRVVLAMVPTLSRRVQEQPQWARWVQTQGEMLLCDEADKCDTPSWKAILNTAKNSVWRAGFSGTFPTDLLGELKFDELLGPIVERVTNADMVERGVSARPLVEVHAFDASADVAHLWKMQPKEWWMMEPTERRQLVYEMAILSCEARHAFVRNLIRPNTPTAVVVNRLEHGRVLTERIPGAVFLDGSASEAERLAELDRFAAGLVPVIVVTKILDRGTNRLGHAADLIFASGEGSSTQILQRIGRGLRRAGGKEFLRLVDVVDHFRVSETNKMMKSAAAYLENAARKRLQVYGEQGFEVQLFPATRQV